jgi:glutamate 5-kinase
MKTDRNLIFASTKRVVIKVGSNVLTQDDGLNIKIIRSLSRQISMLIDKGVEVIFVSSGAMASGLKKVGLQKRPDEIPKRQAVSAVGQAGLIMEYEKAFERFDKKVAQILLTGEDLSSRKRYLNARNTIYTLLSWKIVPIINENDTVAVEEIKFGDNDNLAAMIALLMDADVLVTLTDIDGLYTKDPRSNTDAILIPVVDGIKKNLEKMASGIPGSLGTGGMLSKIKAARKVTAAGIPMVIAQGGKPDILLNLFAGEEEGTYFVPQKERLSRRKCWIAFSLKPQGMIIIDDGAANAVLSKGKSLLPSGISGVVGEFREGAPVEFCNLKNEVLGVGLVNYNSAEINRIKGLKSGKIKEKLGHKPYDEVIHRDNLALTGECD